MKKLILLLTLLVTVIFITACDFKISLKPQNPSDGGTTPGDETPPEEFTVYSSEVKVSLIVGENKATDDDVRGYNTLRNAISELLPGGFFIKSDVYARSEENPSEIVVGHTSRKISNLAYKYLSDKGTLPEGYSHFVIYCYEGAVAIAADGKYAMDAAIDYFLDDIVGGETELILDYDFVDYVSFTHASHEAMLQEREEAARWAPLEAKIGTKAVNAVKKLYNYYGSEWIKWAANLYDPETGFFYYSNSARDNETVTYNGTVYDLKPDVESTCQMLDMMQELGLFREFGGSWIQALPEEMRTKCLAYAQAMQSEADGYFYHPQWGSNISSTRRGRDYSQALLIIRKLGGTPLYTPANDRIENDAAATSAVISAFMESDAHKSSVSLVDSTPDHLKSEDALKTYIDNLFRRNTCHGVGHILSSQASQIKAAGLAEECIAYMDTFQNHETGYWYNRIRNTDEHEYDKISAIIKISSLYGVLGGRMKYMDKIIDSAINTICSDFKPTDHNICFIYNSWGGLGAAMSNVALNNNPNADDNTNIEVARANVLARFPEMIDATIEKLGDFRHTDGSFSFKPGETSPVMEGVPVAIITGQYGDNVFYGLPEGDVNGTTVAVYYTLLGVFSSLRESRLPLLTHDDYITFVEILNEKMAESQN